MAVSSESLFQAFSYFHIKPYVCFSKEKHCLKYPFLLVDSTACPLHCKDSAKAREVQCEAGNASSAFPQLLRAGFQLLHLLFAHWVADVTREFAHARLTLTSSLHAACLFLPKLLWPASTAAGEAACSRQAARPGKPCPWHAAGCPRQSKSCTAAALRGGDV